MSEYSKYSKQSKHLTTKKIHVTVTRIDDTFRKSIPLSKLSFKKFRSDERLKQRTIDSYCSVVHHINQDIPSLTKRNKHRFYYGEYCKPEVINTIMCLMHKIYTIRHGNDLSMRIAPLVTMLNMIPEVPASDLATWISLKNDLKEGDFYADIVKTLDCKQVLTPKTVKDVPEWTALQAKLDKISRSKALDPRLKVLATIYKYGYVLRIASIYNTKIGSDDGKQGMSDHNYLDLEKGVWHINHSKVRVQSFDIPEAMRVELLALVTDGNAPRPKQSVFSHGWILPKKNGQPYTANTGIKHLLPWARLSLPDCIQCRKSFETWHWSYSGNDIEETKKMSIILDHNPTTAVIHYVFPYE